MSRWRRGSARYFVALVFGLGLALSMTGSVVAQDDVDELEELQDEREQVARDAATAVGRIDVVTATVEEVTQALDELEAFVRLQRSRLEDAERRYEGAVADVETAREGQRRVHQEIGVVRDHLADLAVSSFTGEGSARSEDMTELVLSDDPGESARFLHLLDLQTGSLSDGIDRLRSLELEAERLVLAEDAAALEAAESLAVVNERMVQLDEALGMQERVVVGAQIRLEAQIAEAAILQERDVELATKIKDQQASINRRIAVSARDNGVEIPKPVDLDEIVRLDFYEEEGATPESVVAETQSESDEVLTPFRAVEPFFSIEVHTDIAQQTRALFEMAFEDGVDLAGWGYRPIQLQIELRAAHCGGSDYDIWHKPVFECAPPTARPGFSKHEQGRAIDFTVNGASIQSKDNPGFLWLQTHAPQFGFVNLESEPWHWSIAAGDEKMPR